MPHASQSAAILVAKQDFHDIFQNSFADISTELVVVEEGGAISIVQVFDKSNPKDHLFFEISCEQQGYELSGLGAYNLSAD